MGKLKPSEYVQIKRKNLTKKCEKIKQSKYMKCSYKKFEKSDYIKLINKRYK